MELLVYRCIFLSNTLLIIFSYSYYLRLYAWAFSCGTNLLIFVITNEDKRSGLVFRWNLSNRCLSKLWQLLAESQRGVGSEVLEMTIHSEVEEESDQFGQPSKRFFGQHSIIFRQTICSSICSERVHFGAPGMSLRASMNICRLLCLSICIHAHLHRKTRTLPNISLVQHNTMCGLLWPEVCFKNDATRCLDHMIVI